MKIASIPTIYAGVQFRSRLEARWAAFFDLVGLRWEYEPFDLAGWIPDFKIYDFPLMRPSALATKSDLDFGPGALLAHGGDVLAEVKPVTMCCGALGTMDSADGEVLTGQRAKIGNSHDVDIVVLGLGPIAVAGTVFEYHLEETGYVSGCDGVAVLHDCWSAMWSNLKRRCWGQAFWEVPRPDNIAEDAHEDHGESRMRALWVEAGNLTQYKPPRTR